MVPLLGQALRGVMRGHVLHQGVHCLGVARGPAGETTGTGAGAGPGPEAGAGAHWSLAGAGASLLRFWFPAGRVRADKCYVGEVAEQHHAAVDHEQLLPLAVPGEGEVKVTRCRVSCHL